MKKSKDCLECGCRILPSRWKIKYCEGCESKVKQRHKKFMSKVFEKTFAK